MIPKHAWQTECYRSSTNGILYILSLILLTLELCHDSLKLHDNMRATLPCFVFLSLDSNQQPSSSCHVLPLLPPRVPAIFQLKLTEPRSLHVGLYSSSSSGTALVN